MNVVSCAPALGVFPPDAGGFALRATADLSHPTAPPSSHERRHDLDRFYRARRAGIVARPISTGVPADRAETPIDGEGDRGHVTRTGS